MQSAQVVIPPLMSVISCLPVHCCACKGARAGAGREHGPLHIAAGPTLAVCQPPVLLPASPGLGERMDDGAAAMPAPCRQPHAACAMPPAQLPTAVTSTMRLAHCIPHSPLSTHAKCARDARGGRPVLPCRPPPCLHQRAACGCALRSCAAAESVASPVYRSTQQPALSAGRKRARGTLPAAVKDLPRRPAAHWGYALCPIHVLPLSYPVF
jgi:hypothetical protein